MTITKLVAGVAIPVALTIGAAGLANAEPAPAPGYTVAGPATIATGSALPVFTTPKLIQPTETGTINTPLPQHVSPIAAAQPVASPMENGAAIGGLFGALASIPGGLAGSAVGGVLGGAVGGLAGAALAAPTGGISLAVGPPLGGVIVPNVLP